MVNKHILIGRIGTDPVVKESQNGSPYGYFSVATDAMHGSEKKTTWHQVWVFGRLAEVVRDNYQKGRLVYVEGRVDIETKDVDGAKKVSVRTLADTCRLLSSGEAPQAQAPAPQRKPVAPARAPMPEPLDDTGLPF